MRNALKGSPARFGVSLGVTALAVSGMVYLGQGIPSASAADATVNLRSAKYFAVLAGSTITNTGPSVVNGDLGLSPGSAVSGFDQPGGPGIVNGQRHVADGVALRAKQALTSAYNNAAGRSPKETLPREIGSGTPLTSGVYATDTEMHLAGSLILDGEGNPDSVFIFQAGSTLITGSNAAVELIGEAQPCNVFWQVSSSATLGTNTDFVGTIMAAESATLNTGADLEGRVLASESAVTLDTNTISRPF